MDKVIEQAKRDLVIANRILAMEGVVDAYGHASVRHPKDPGRFFLARSLSPELVGLDDIMEFTLDGKPVGGDARSPYLERFIHGALYEKRPDATNAVHAHAEATRRMLDHYLHTAQAADRIFAPTRDPVTLPAPAAGTAPEASEL